MTIYEKPANGNSVLLWIVLKRCFYFEVARKSPTQWVPASEIPNSVRPLSGFIVGRVLPAHDLVGEEDATHLWVLVLTFIQDGLMGQTQTQR